MDKTLTFQQWAEVSISLRNYAHDLEDSLGKCDRVTALLELSAALSPWFEQEGVA